VSFCNPFSSDPGTRWIPFDASRNFPDLGVRFDAGERVARGRLLAAKLATESAVPSTTSPNHPSAHALSPTRPERLLRPTGPREASSEAADVPRARWGDDERDFEQLDWTDETVESDERDLSWSTVLKRTFEAFVRGDRANLYGEMISWKED
jgi:WD repeat and SOF domain-containing protein 1